MSTAIAKQELIKQLTVAASKGDFAAVSSLTSAIAALEGKPQIAAAPDNVRPLRNVAADEARLLQVFGVSKAAFDAMDDSPYLGSLNEIFGGSR